MSVQPNKSYINSVTLQQEKKSITFFSTLGILVRLLFALRGLRWGFYCGRRGQESMELPFSDFYKMAACFKSGVTLKGLGGVENAAVVVVDSCALDVKLVIIGL